MPKGRYLTRVLAPKRVQLENSVLEFDHNPPIPTDSSICHIRPISIRDVKNVEAEGCGEDLSRTRNADRYDPSLLREQIQNGGENCSLVLRRLIRDLAQILGKEKSQQANSKRSRKAASEDNYKVDRG